MMKGVPEIPRWGEEVLATGRSEQIGGQGANLARAAVRLGLSTELAAVVGDDEPGRASVRRSRPKGSVLTRSRSAAGRTAFAVAAVRPDGERAFITDLATSASLSVEDLNRHEEAIHSIPSHRAGRDVEPARHRPGRRRVPVGTSTRSWRVDGL